MNKILSFKHLFAMLTSKQAFCALLCFFLLSLLDTAHAVEETSSDVLPVLNMSQIKNTDISQLAKYYKYQGQQIPDKKADLRQWLNTLPKHVSSSQFGDQFIAAFSLKNDSDIQSWFIYLFGSPVEHIQIAQYDGFNLVNKITTGLQKDNAFPYHYGGGIQLEANQTATIVVSFDSGFFAGPIKLVVKPEKSAVQQFRFENLILILSLGVCLALSLYNLFIYMGTGSKQYFYYALSTFGFTLAWALLFGVFNELLPNFNLIWIIVCFSLGICFAVLFTISFLQLNKHYSKAHKYFKALGFLSTISIAVAFINIGAGILLVSVFSTLALLLSLYFGIQSCRQGYRPAYYYVLALISVLLPNLVVNLINFNLISGIEANALLFGQLGNSFDSLLLAFALADKVRLTNSQNAKLTQELEANVQQRTSQLSAANNQLERLIVELREANSAKSHFLASMSHEIRTPLTSIIGYAQSIQRHEVDNSQQPEVIKTIADNGKHLLGVINDILDISKIEANKLEFEAIPTPLLTIVQQIETVMQKRAQDKGIDYCTDYHFPLPDLVISDPVRLKQILFNLTNNALKFTEHGRVVLTLSRVNHELLFKVTDTGIGMTQAQCESLFMPFQQADSSTSRHYGGTGLGLSISKHLALGLGGDITVRSELKLGSEFMLSLPYKPCQGATMRNSLELQPNQSQPQETSECEGLDFNQARVLLVDDHPDVRKLASLLLQNMHCEVTAAASGAEALELVANQHAFHVILLDIQMPDMDGFETLEKLRYIGCKTPVIAFTANNTQAEIAQYQAVGFADYLTKPIDRVKFKQSLCYFLQANIKPPAMLSAEQQYELTLDYYQNLKQSLQQCIQAFREQDWQSQQALSHQIKGSAESFGFDLFAQIFSELDVALKKQNEHQCADIQQKIEQLTQRYTNVPNIDICQGINKHQNSLICYQKGLTGFVENAPQQLNLIQEAITNKQYTLMRSLVVKLAFEAEKYALNGFTQHFDMLQEYLAFNLQDQALYKKQLKMLSRKLTKLKQWLHAPST